MKRILFSFGLLASTIGASAQVAVTVTNPSNSTPVLAGTYSSLSAAITALNATTSFSGPVTLTCNNGTETAPVGGYAISFTAASSATNNVIIDGGGSTITASNALTAGNLNDAIFKIIGSDYVTLKNFTMQENTANTTSATAATNNMTEWGVALLYASATNGAQNNIIQNNTISLNRSYLNTFGIYSNTRHSATSVTAAAEVTSAAGSNSFNKVYGNTISNVNFGIVFIGAGSTLAAIDNGNDIGGSSANTGNVITNWGGGAALSAYSSLTGSNYCIFDNQQINDNVSFNTITSAALTQSVTTGGFLKNYSVAQPATGTVTTTNISNNIISVTNNPTATTTGSIIGINNQGITTLLSTATININNNTVQNCVLGGTTSTTNGITALTNLSIAGIANVNNNAILNNSITSTAATSGNLLGISNSGASSALSISGNKIRGLTSSSTSVGGIISTAGTTQIYKNNISAILSNNAGATVYGIIAQTGGTYNIYNNFISDLKAPTATNTSSSSVTGVFLGAIAANLYYNSFVLGNTGTLTSTGANFGVTGIQYNTTANKFYNNIIWIDATPSGVGTVAAMRRATSGTANTAPTTTNFDASNNIYFVQNPGTNKYLYVEGAITSNVKNGYGINIGITDDATNNLRNDPNFNSGCSLYKAFMGSGREGGTFNENNLVASGAPDYTFTPSGTSFASNTAQNITSPNITDDYTGNVRSSTPDIGALEFSGNTIDATVPAISFNNLSNTHCTAPPSLNATITDANGINVASGTAPRLYLRKAGGATTETDVFLNYPAENTSAFNGWKYVEATGTAPNFSFTFDFSLLTSPVVDGDSIAYFVVAQDMTGNVGKNLINFSSGFCPASVNISSGAAPTSASLGYKISTVTGNYITTANGEWNNSTTWVCGLIPPASATNVIVAHNIMVSNTGNIGGNVTINSGASLTIKAGGILTLGNAGGDKISLNDNGTLQVEEGGRLNVNGNISINTGSNFNQSGGDIFIDGNANGVAANSSSAISMEVKSNLGTVTGGNIIFVDPPATDLLGTLVFNIPSAMHNLSWDRSHHVVLGDGISTDVSANTLGFMVNTYAGNGLCKVGSIIANGGSGTNRFGRSASTAGDYTLINCDLVINAGSNYRVLTLTSTFTFIGGNIVNNGTFVNTGGLVFLKVVGSSLAPVTEAQTIGGSGIFNNSLTASTASFATFEMMNSNPSGVTLLVPISISGSFFLDDGILNTTSANMLTMGISSTTTGTITRGTTAVTGWINGPVKKWVTAAAGSTTIPLGSATLYKPATINFTTAPTTGGTLTASFNSSQPSFSNAAPLTEGALTVDKVSNQGSWFIDAGDGLTGGAYTASFTANGATDVIDYTKTVLLKRPSAGGDWTLNGTHVTTTGSNTAPVLSRTGMSGFSEFAIGGQNAVALPIDIVYFRGNKQDKVNVIDWKVNCIKSISMELERSIDSRNFKTIYAEEATVVRCENSFSYIDNNPSYGVSYYRLKTTDSEGKVKYSKIISFSNNEGRFELVSVVPNPVISTATLVFNAVNDGNTNIVVTDATGRVVLKQTAWVSIGKTSVNMDFSRLAKGVYNISATDENGQLQTVRFVKE